MKTIINAIDITDDKKLSYWLLEETPIKISLEIDAPDICPLCKVFIAPKILGSYYQPMGNRKFAYIIALCNHCQKCFIVGFESNNSYKDLKPAYIGPMSPGAREFESRILSLSPSFVEIYNQSYAAEQLDLNEISGIGYRKAIEFLIKDYLCHKNPEQSEAIKNEFLGNSIKRLNHPQIKNLAEKAVWIGNDETHYIKKHENRDIQDLKMFLDALLHYIESELVFEEALLIERL